MPKNWIVRIYRDNTIIKSWTIENRMEHEAFNEAAADISREFPDGDVDWTMMAE